MYHTWSFCLLHNCFIKTQPRKLKILIWSRSLVVEWLAHFTAMREISRSNQASYLIHTYWNTRVGKSNWPPCWPSGGQQVSHQRLVSRNIYHIHLCQVWVRLPTLALKPRADVTRSQNQGYQCPHKKDMCPWNFLFILCFKITYFTSNFHHFNSHSLANGINDIFAWFNYTSILSCQSYEN